LVSGHQNAQSGIQVKFRSKVAFDQPLNVGDGIIQGGHQIRSPKLLGGDLLDVLRFVPDPLIALRAGIPLHRYPSEPSSRVI
jgi:hypothetical protein